MGFTMLLIQLNIINMINRVNIIGKYFIVFPKFDPKELNQKIRQFYQSSLNNNKNSTP